MPQHGVCHPCHWIINFFITKFICVLFKEKNGFLWHVKITSQSASRSTSSRHFHSAYESTGCLSYRIQFLSRRAQVHYLAVRFTWHLFENTRLASLVEILSVYFGILCFHMWAHCLCLLVTLCNELLGYQPPMRLIIAKDRKKSSPFAPPFRFSNIRENIHFTPF